MDPSAPVAQSVVLFDGDCHFCNASVRFIAARDPAGRFHFAALRSATGQALLARHGLPPDLLETMVLVEDGDRAFVRSRAALRIARRLAGPSRLLYALALVPRPLRDLAYGVVARWRHRIVGRADACALPTPDLLKRFIE
jgi:predicted DCC family thiol-disulfide oxidoreductase YuxK